MGGGHFHIYPPESTLHKLQINHLYSFLDNVFTTRYQDAPLIGYLVPCPLAQELIAASHQQSLALIMEIMLIPDIKATFSLDAKMRRSN
jgi:hypothetical protein